MAKKIKRKIIGYTLLAVAILLIALSVLIRMPFFQTYLTRQVTQILSEKLGSKVSIEKVNFTLYSHLQLDKIYIQDDHHDTLLFINNADVSLGALSFFNKKIDIKTLRLSHIRFYIAKDKNGKINFTEIMSKLKGNGKKKEQPIAGTKKKKPWTFNFQKLVLDDLHVKYDDNFLNGHLDVVLPNGQIVLKTLDLANKRIAIDYARLSNVDVSYNKGIYNFVDSSSHNIHFLGDMLLTYKNVDIEHSHFSYNDWRKPEDTAGMDFFHMDVKKIEIHVADGRIDHDTIFGQVNRLSCAEKCGFRVLEMSSNARVSTSDITLKALHLKTDNSLIADYLQFRYDSFPDFKKFISKVRINSSLKNTDLSLKDLNYFAKNALAKIDHNHFWIDGQISGTVDDIRGRNISLKAGMLTEFKGKFSMQGLPIFKETFISASIEYAKTNLTDIQRIYPDLVVPDFLNNLGMVSYTGKFDGFPLDFVADGNINTDIGKLNADLNFKLPPNSKPIYSGHLITYDFDIGKFFDKENMVGTLSMDANLKGSGINLADLNTGFDGKVNHIFIKDYNYKDIDIDGSFKKKLFTGNLKIKDDNLDLTFNGSVNLDSTLPQFNFTADIKKADLRALHLFNKNLIISAYSSIHFSGKKLDNFNGAVDLKDIELKTDSGSFPIDHLEVNSYTNINGIRSLTLSSSIANASINGVFSYSQLPKIFKSYFQHYSLLPNFINLDTVGYANVDFTASVIDAGELTHLLSKNFSTLKNATANGSFDSRQNKLILHAEIPELAFGQLKFKNIEVDSKSDNGIFTLDAKLDKMYSKDSILLAASHVTANWRADRYFDFTAFTSTRDSLYRADLKGIIGTDYKKLVGSLNHSELLINNQKWAFVDGNSITYSKKYLNTQNLILKQDEKEIYITTIHPEDSITNLELDLSNISVNDFSKIIDKSKNNYFGKADGGLEIHDLFHKSTYFSNLYIADLGVNKDTLGNLYVSMEVQDFKTKIPVNVKLKGRYNDIEAKGTYTPGKIENAIDLNVDINKFKVDIINNYLGAYVTKASGYALGQIKVSGTDKNPQLTGFINLKKCEATVAYINTHYRLDNEIIKFKENEIRFDNVILKDDNNGVAIAGGGIKHNHLRNFFFDINVTTDYFQMLRTTQKENPIYWGTINLTGATALFQGPLKNIAIKVSGATAKNSTLTIPIRTTAETDNYTFFKFVNAADTILVKPKIVKPKSLVDVSIDLDVTEDAEMNLILDPSSGDRITSKGNGNIKVGYNDNGGLKVQGEYTIASGNYFFTLQNIINKYFTIDKGSSITFDGDVYDAILDVNAVYSIRTAPYDLIADRISDNEELKSIAGKRVPTKLILLLKGPLIQPIIDFNVKIDNVDPRIQTYVDTKISALKSDKDQLNKQAASLLVMNSFYPAGLGTGALLSGSATSTFSELLSTQISNLVSRFIGNFLKDFDIRVEYKPYSQEGSSGNDIYIGVRQSILGQRLVLNAGGNINLTNKNSVKNQNQYNIDFSAEYQVTKDGRIKLKAYNKTSVGTSTTQLYSTTGNGNTNSTGLGISYREEFDDFKDLREQWKARRENRRRKKQQKEKEEFTKTSSEINVKEDEKQEN